MSIEQLFNYLSDIQLLEVAKRYMLQMNEDDLFFVLETILPNETNLSNLVLEITQWQQTNQDITKK